MEQQLPNLGFGSLRSFNFNLNTTVNTTQRAEEKIHQIIQTNQARKHCQILSNTAVN